MPSLGSAKVSPVLSAQLKEGNLHPDEQHSQVQKHWSHWKGLVRVLIVKARSLCAYPLKLRTDTIVSAKERALLNKTFPLVPQ